MGGSTGGASSSDRKKTPESAGEQVNQPRSRRNKRRAESITAGVCLSVVLGLGSLIGYTLRDSEVTEITDQRDTNAQKLTATDWLLDRDFTMVASNEGVTEQDGNIYVRLEDPEHCDRPVSFSFEGESLVWEQKDQQGALIDRVEIKDAEYARAVLNDVCPKHG